MRILHLLECSLLRTFVFAMFPTGNAFQKIIQNLSTPERTLLRKAAANVKLLFLNLQILFFFF